LIRPVRAVGEVGQEAADGRGASLYRDVGVEQGGAVGGDAVGDAGDADSAAGTGGPEGLLGGLFGADAFENAVGADAVGHVPDVRHPVVAAFGDDVGGAELGGQPLRDSWRDMMTMRPAPSSRAARTAP
jgi:hypothetical protein